MSNGQTHCNDSRKKKCLYISITTIVVVSVVAILYFKPNISNWVLFLSGLLVIILMIFRTVERDRFNRPKTILIGIDIDTRKFLKEQIEIAKPLNKMEELRQRLSESNKEKESLLEQLNEQKEQRKELEEKINKIQTRCEELEVETRKLKEKKEPTSSELEIILLDNWKGKYSLEEFAKAIKDKVADFRVKVFEGVIDKTTGSVTDTTIWVVEGKDRDYVFPQYNQPPSINLFKFYNIPSGSAYIRSIKKPAVMEKQKNGEVIVADKGDI